MKVRVLIPFHMSATNTDHVPDDVIEVTANQLAKIRAININMVEVVKEVEEPAEAQEKPKTKKQKNK